jgi:hypothetical protein
MNNVNEIKQQAVQFEANVRKDSKGIGRRMCTASGSLWLRQRVS